MSGPLRRTYLRPKLTNEQGPPESCEAQALKSYDQLEDWAFMNRDMNLSHAGTSLD